MTMFDKNSLSDWLTFTIFCAMFFCLLQLTGSSTGSAGQASDRFIAGDRVLAVIRTPVQADPNGEPVLAVPLPGAQGTIQDAGLEAGGAVWWRVAFDEGFTGWTREQDLQAVEAGVKAFPTAEGFGAEALGGRGGEVIEVTNLDDSGSGSLRDAIEARGPRTVVFRVGGTITVDRPLRIRDPYITIAGQTAPGDGIMVRNGRFNTEPPMTVETHDVVIRHLRLRPGPSAVPSCCVDALGLRRGTSDVIIDHVSLSWAVDEDIGASDDARDLTVQWSIVAEALNRSSHGKDKRHSRGMLASTRDGGNFSIHHNLFAHNAGRNPEVSMAFGSADIVNNVVYNPGVRMIELSDHYGVPHANLVGNYYRIGKNTKRGNTKVNNHLIKARAEPNGTGGGFVLFARGNFDEIYRTDDSLPDALALIEGDRRYLVAERRPAPFVATTLAERAYADVLDQAGATLPRRDAVDQRIVGSVRDRKGRIIDHPLEVGGWPELASGTPPTDTDHDGMPDQWEGRFGLDLADPGDRNGDFNTNGYTNLEDYLNELAGDIRLPPPTDSASLEPNRQR